MSVRGHRIAALATCLVGLASLFPLLPLLAREVVATRGDRQALQGTWRARLVQSSEHSKVEGGPASGTTFTFDGTSVVLRNRVEGGDASGAFYLTPGHSPPWIDFKLDAGWAIGAYRIEGDRLFLRVNPIAMPERFGIPTRPRPAFVGPGSGAYYYELEKVR